MRGSGAGPVKGKLAYRRQPAGGSSRLEDREPLVPGVAPTHQPYRGLGHAESLGEQGYDPRVGRIVHRGRSDLDLQPPALGSCDPISAGPGLHPYVEHYLVGVTATPGDSIANL